MDDLWEWAEPPIPVGQHDIVRHLDTPTTKFIPLIRETDALDRKDNKLENFFTPFLDPLYCLVLPPKVPSGAVYTENNLFIGPDRYHEGIVAEIMYSEEESDFQDLMVRRRRVYSFWGLMGCDRGSLNLYELDSGVARVLHHGVSGLAYIILEGGWQNW